MSQLYKHLRIHQIFGANTDVGKTILTTALARASAARNIPVFYLKPVSTGRPEDADDRFVNFATLQISAQDYDRHIDRYGGAPNLIETCCLYRYDEPVSPHLAAKLKNGTNVGG
jgi:bifunctional dethiobiotin synthetase / adenosylmethionine---8-amino-7-oxononanoate aminotransferase